MKTIVSCILLSVALTVGSLLIACLYAIMGVIMFLLILLQKGNTAFDIAHMLDEIEISKQMRETVDLAIA